MFSLRLQSLAPSFLARNTADFSQRESEEELSVFPLPLVGCICCNAVKSITDTAFVHSSPLFDSVCSHNDAITSGSCPWLLQTKVISLDSPIPHARTERCKPNSQLDTFAMLNQIHHNA